MTIRAVNGPPSPLAALIGLAYFLLVTTALADEMEAIFYLYVNQVEAGEVFAVLRDDDVLLPRQALETAGLEGFQATQVVVGEHTLVSLSSIRPKLRFVVDEEEIALRVMAPVELLPSHYIDLASGPPGVSYERKSSLFFNYGPRIVAPTTGNVSGEGFFELGASESNRLYYTGYSADTNGDVTRGLTSVNFDDRERLRRVTLGDSSVAAGPIGGFGVVGGITFARDFDLDPFFVRAPAMRFAASTEVPAIVDVYVNGIKVRSETVQPGTFTLDNLRTFAGAGTARYEVRDALGRQRNYFQPYYIGPTVLGSGVDDYAVSAGLIRRSIAADSFDYATPSLVSYYRRGMDDSWTLGGRLEGRWDRLSVGTVVATAGAGGSVELEVGGSLAVDEQFGGAAVLSYQFLSPRFNTTASVRALTDHYSTVSLAPDTDRSVLQANVSMSVPIRDRVSFVAQHMVDMHRDTPLIARVSGLTQIQVSRDMSLAAELALVTFEPPRSSWDSFVSLSYAPGSGLHTSLGAATTNGKTSANAQVSRSGQLGEDWSMDAALDASETTRSSIRSRVQTRTNTISTFFDHTPAAASLSLEPAGSVVWIEDGGLFPSRPVYDGFALVRVPNVNGVRVYLNSQETSETNEEGYAIVPALRSYFPARLSLASEDVPLDYSLEQDAKVVAAPRRGAAYAEFPAKRVNYQRGQLVLYIRGSATEPTFGDLLVEQDGDYVTSPIGLGGAFEFEGLSPGRHEAIIRFEEHRCHFSFEVPAVDELLIDLGVLECRIE